VTAIPPLPRTTGTPIGPVLRLLEGFHLLKSYLTSLTEAQDVGRGGRKGGQLEALQRVACNVVPFSNCKPRTGTRCVWQGTRSLCPTWGTCTPGVRSKMESCAAEGQAAGPLCRQALLTVSRACTWMRAPVRSVSLRFVVCGAAECSISMRGARGRCRAVYGLSVPCHDAGLHAAVDQDGGRVVLRREHGESR
jgi:hypothetical protein